MVSIRIMDDARMDLMGNAKQIEFSRVAATALYALALFCLLTGSAHGQEIVSGSPDKGALFADRFCSNCHLMDDGSGNAVPAGIPTFRGIANKPGQTGMHIVGVLMAPHPPMPNINLSREEIGDIIAYLQGLRADQTLPPLLPTPSQRTPKPKFPAPT